MNTSTENDPIQALILKHADLLEMNIYADFELTYTHHSLWMACLCTPAVGAMPNYKILAKGQGINPAMACKTALDSFKEPNL